MLHYWSPYNNVHPTDQSVHPTNPIPYHMNPPTQTIAYHINQSPPSPLFSFQTISCHTTPLTPFSPAPHLHGCQTHDELSLPVTTSTTKERQSHHRLVLHLPEVQESISLLLYNGFSQYKVIPGDHLT